MEIEKLISLVTTDFLNEIIRESYSGTTLTLLKSKPAEFPYLEAGASNNALFFGANGHIISGRTLSEATGSKSSQ
jgi:hypothetical protein